LSGLTHESPVNGSIEWYTPAWIFEALGLTFDLDPCHPAERLPWVPAQFVWTQADDGLKQSWHGRIWLNPPYGPHTKTWLAKMAAHCDDGWGMNPRGEGIALVFSRTDTDWFHEYGVTADAVCFLRKRVSFVGPDGEPRPGKDGQKGSPGAGSMLLAWGPQCVAAVVRSGLGAVMVRYGI
jgi:hypothetical protein